MDVRNEFESPVLSVTFESIEAGRNGVKWFLHFIQRKCKSDVDRTKGQPGELL